MRRGEERRVGEGKGREEERREERREEGGRIEELHAISI